MAIWISPMGDPITIAAKCAVFFLLNRIDYSVLFNELDPPETILFPGAKLTDFSSFSK
jgi:hypothetical protein